MQNIRGRTLSVLVVIGFALVAMACGGLTEEGGLGEACLADGSCDSGLVCNAANICEQAAASGFTALYNSSSFQSCSGCHAPGAPGFTAGTEATQDWSSQANAHASLQGTASGLIGNFEGCNDVPFINQTPEDSLLVAVFDETVRANFSLNGFPDCDSDAISDMSLKIGDALSQQELTLLRDWITAGAPND
jgi:hypothetical protein